MIDTGISGDLPDFRTSQGSSTSRVAASAVIDPNATTANDTYGHGTAVAGLVAGNGWDRDSGDPLYGQYAGTAPNANLISIKIADDSGAATILDAIYGLQFAVDHKADYNIRVVNLSFRSSSAQSYTTDPLDAAVEQAWFHGITVVAAAGNLGSAPDAVSYAPGNDPYVITVGATNTQGTSSSSDDVQTSWSSRGVTQDGFQKPDVLAPGAHIVSTLAPGSSFASACPTCVIRRGVLPAQRHVAGRPDRRRYSRGPPRRASRVDAGDGQGRDRRHSCAADRRGRRGACDGSVLGQWQSAHLRPEPAAE